MFEDAELIHRYTRADAIRDGVLIDVSATVREAGFKYPAALTAAAWSRCVEILLGEPRQDEADRLWDVLTRLRVTGSVSCAADRPFSRPRTVVSARQTDSGTISSATAHLNMWTMRYTR